MIDRWRVDHGDALEWLRAMPDCSVDAMVTDPPAGISFMGREWDGSKGGRDQWIAWLRGIMAEALRVLKPGAHAFVWALPRTSHWTATALEDAGFEIREKHYHLFGSGFPKSLDVSKAIDAAAGAEREVLSERPGTGSKAMCGEASGKGFGPTVEITAPATDLARQWNGWGTATKPAAEEWILVRKPLDGTVAANVERWGCGGLNVDGCRIELRDDEDPEALFARSGGKRGFPQDQYVGGMVGGKSPPGWDNSKGRWPPNVYLTHSASCRVVGNRTVKGDNRGEPGGKRQGGFVDTGSDSGDGKPNARVYGDSTEPLYKCAPDCPVRAVGEQSGVRSNGGQNATSKRGGQGVCYGEKTPSNPTAFAGDTGTAARFFHNFTYAAKPSRAEREAGCDHIPPVSGAEAVDRDEGAAGTQNPRAGAGRTASQVHNNHPTVKGDALMRVLVRLVTPPGGLVIDPFTGSGSTGRACMLEGFRFAGCELEERHVEIARARIAHVVGWSESPHEKPEAPETVKQRTLF